MKNRQIQIIFTIITKALLATLLLVVALSLAACSSKDNMPQNSQNTQDEYEGAVITMFRDIIASKNAWPAVTLLEPNVSGVDPYMGINVIAFCTDAEGNIVDDFQDGDELNMHIELENIFAKEKPSEVRVSVNNGFYSYSFADDNLFRIVVQANLAQYSDQFTTIMYPIYALNSDDLKLCFVADNLPDELEISYDEMRHTIERTPRNVDDEFFQFYFAERTAGAVAEFDDDNTREVIFPVRVVKVDTLVDLNAPAGFEPPAPGPEGANMPAPPPAPSQGGPNPADANGMPPAPPQGIPGGPDPNVQPPR